MLKKLTAHYYQWQPLLPALAQIKGIERIFILSWVPEWEEVKEEQIQGDTNFSTLLEGKEVFVFVCCHYSERKSNDASTTFLSANFWEKYVK